MSEMDALVAWLTGALDEIERVAKRATREWYVPGDMTVRGKVSTLSAAYNDVLVVKHTWPQEADHMVLNDPRAVLARVEAERAVVALWSKDWDGEIAARLDGLGMRHAVLEQLTTGSVRSVLTPTLKALAYGHRHDAEGYLDEWKPESVKD